VLIFCLAEGFDYGTEDDGRAFLSSVVVRAKPLATKDTKVHEGKTKG
jgi:hypothetical protein